MKRPTCLLSCLVLLISLALVSCSEDPTIPDLELKLTRVVFEKAKNDSLVADVEASINHDERTVLATIDVGDLSSLEPSLYGEGAGSYEPAGKQDFSNPVFYNIISKDGFSSLGYLITVVPGGDASAVALAKQWLTVGYAAGESASAVSNDVTLVGSSTNGCAISWESSETNIVIAGNVGTVFRPSYSSGNIVVTLTATISKGAAKTTKSFILSLAKKEITDQERLNEDLGAAVIGYQSGDSATSITKDLTLPLAGTAHGSAFVWTSSNTAVIANDGTVTRPEFGPAGDALVTLHLAGTKNAASGERIFANLKVLQKEDPAIALVAAAQAALAITYQAGESASAVTNNVTLPSSVGAVTVSWESSLPATISTNGTVTRPPFASGDSTVRLTARLSKTTYPGAPERTATKTFDLTVIKLPPSDSESVAADAAELAITYAAGDSATSITQNVGLTNRGSWGSTISWAVTTGTAIAANGTITRPGYSAGDATVTLTATIQKGTQSTNKVFDGLIVKKLAPVTDAEKVSADKDNLAIGYQGGDSAAGVTKSLTLATTGTNAGVTITWVSSDPAVIGTDGTVTQPAIGQPDVTLSLTATITSGGVSETKSFTVTVKALRAFAALFDGSDFETVMSLNSASGITHTWSSDQFVDGAKSLHVKGKLTKGGKLLATGKICKPKGSHTKVVFWIKGKSTGSNTASLSVFQLCGNNYYLLGTKTDADVVDGGITLSEGSNNNYNGHFEFNNWTKIILPLPSGKDPAGRAFEIRGGKGNYDFYIDSVSYE